MTHLQIIDKWPSLTEFAADIGVPYGTAKAMRRRGSVPAAYWSQMAEQANLRGIKGVSLESLAGALTASRPKDRAA